MIWIVWTLCTIAAGLIVFDLALLVRLIVTRRRRGQ